MAPATIAIIILSIVAFALLVGDVILYARWQEDKALLGIVNARLSTIEKDGAYPERDQELAELRSFIKSEPDLALAWKWKCEAVEATTYLEERSAIWGKERGEYNRTINHLQAAVAIRDNALANAAEKQVLLASENVEMANALAALKRQPQ